jgi:putative phosphoserine phosphatase/1-acylglycerol-3-phosphate O-acyltransferase
MAARTTRKDAPGTGNETLRRQLAAIGRAERGPHVAALFDFDGTIVAGYSVFAFLREKMLGGEMSALELGSTVAAVTQYATGRIDFQDLVATGARFAAGLSEERYGRLGEQLFEKHLARRIYPEIRELIRAHGSRGHTIVIVSSATMYQIGPAARELGVDHILCTRFEVRKGVFTGAVESPVCFGPGKRAAAEALAARRGIDLAKTYFYSDGHEDLPLLERVGKPRPVNPQPALQSLAQVRGWPVLRFASRSAPGVLDYARGLSPFPTLAGAIVAGLPILALTRSTRETANFVVGAFGDFATAIAGVQLEVRGERNLWLGRPCVFVFNHQSNADVFIVAKLLRRDIAGIAKRELRGVPILGRIMELGGLVFVDRGRGADAVRAMQPLVDALRRDGKSVCIAPEGTRSLTGALGPFKKGAFHLAIQAHVPIVPIVIHNSRDVQPKHELAMRSARVRVDVLPPIDTSRWRAATIDRHVAQVRRHYLDCLAQR